MTAISLGRHLEDIRSLVVGIAVYGDEGSIDILYDGEKHNRKDSSVADAIALNSAGYRARIVGRARCVAIDLTNVGTAMDARYIK